MSEPGSFAYLPWVRRGISTQISRRDDDVPAAPRPRGTVDVTLPFDAPGESVIVRDIALVGPGEIETLADDAMGREWPPDGATDAESNYFPLLEFRAADLPWRYTPASASLQDRLRPWCVLVTLRDDGTELLGLEPASSDRKLAIATIAADAPLPRLAQSWAWAHAEVCGTRLPDPAGLSTILRNEPGRVVSRLLCPRRLAPATAYRVLLVPAFRRGVMTGLGERPGPAVDGMAPAWDPGPRQAPLRLPVYRSWRFLTGPGGDFESLVDRLAKQPLPPEVGRRPVDMSTPGAGLPAPSSTPLEAEGALRAAGSASSPWDPDERDAWLTELGRLLALPQDLLAGSGRPREVAVPWYGRWHAALRDLTPAVPPPDPWPWWAELNADPRLRVAAALGTAVVRTRQQELMASAWRQVEAVRRVNAELRAAQLAREQAARILTRHVATGGINTVLQVTAPVHSRVRGPTGATVRAALRRGAVDIGVLEPQFRRLSRPLGKLGRRQGRPGRVPAPGQGLLERLRDGTLAAARTPPTPKGLVSLPLAGLTADRLDPRRLARLPRATGYTPREILPGEAMPDDPPVRVSGSGPHPLEDAAIACIGDVLAPPAKEPDPVPVDLTELLKTVLTALDPATTIGAADGGRVTRPGPRPADPLEPVLAAPSFPQPMVEPLRELGQEWILPGLDRVPPNSVSLAVTNRRFVEAYLVGLNHELGRELLWNGYPTDQRGTAFARFWDPSGALGTPPDDIEPIAGWTGVLGANAAGAQADEDRIVLVLRGDLLRRYPDAVLTASKAAPGPAFDLAAEERHPVFSGTVEPDVSYFGFDLTADEVTGRDGGDGWYLVFCEQPSGTRFGLDESDVANPMTTWADLTWAHVDASEGNVDVTKGPLTGPPLDPAGAGWGGSGSDHAVITAQRPVRVAVHGARLVPE